MTEKLFENICAELLAENASLKQELLLEQEVSADLRDEIREIRREMAEIRSDYSWEREAMRERLEDSRREEWR